MGDSIPDNDSDSRARPRDRGRRVLLIIPLNAVIADEFARRASQYAKDLSAQLIICYIVSRPPNVWAFPGVYPGELLIPESNLEPILRTCQRTAELVGADVVVRALHGGFVRAIRQVVEEVDAELVLIGQYGERGIVEYVNRWIHRLALQWIQLRIRDLSVIMLTPTHASTN